MNEYQEALNMVIRFIEGEKGCAGMFFQHRGKTYESIETLQELVDKEKPMKAGKIIRGRSGNIKYKFTQYNCPNCNFEVSKSYHSVFTPNENNYCPNCGQHIDWSDEE